MPELKRSFSLGQMNKDLDERLVKNGTYRDALNIEVSTSEGSDVGAVQTLKGNTVLTTAVESGSTCVGSIADEQNDKIYWLVAGNASGLSSGSNDAAITVFRDYILEYEISNTTLKYVFVDIYKSTAVTTSTVSNSTTIPVGDATYIRKGMQVSGVAGMPLVTVTAISSLNITVSENVTIPDASTVTFESPTVDENNPGKPGGRTLNYSSSRLITGLNVIDGMLLWTDNHSEPKKINIARSILGTGANDLTISNGAVSTFHTRLVITDENNDDIIVTDTGSYPVYMQEQYITVIKKSPLLAPVLAMSDTLEARGETKGITTTAVRFYDTTPNPNEILEAGETITISIGSLLGTGLPDYREGDIILLSNTGATNFTEHKVRAQINVGGTPLQNGSSNDFDITILAIDQSVPDADETWNIVLELTPPLFEKKFVRFASRFKYEDGEYSAFSPFTNVAFLPAEFEYYASEGYNLGMSNNLRSLKIQDFVPEKSILPQDVVAIDILYKEDGSPNVYTVKTVDRNSAEWIAAGSGNGLNNGELLIESDVIYATLPANQLLRPFDEVPRKALAQDITGGRIVYGNYLHKFRMEGYSVKAKNISVNLNTLLEFNEIANIGIPEKSLKSLRNYQVGIVYRDIYGRETPVLTSENVIGSNNVLQIDKLQCITSNKIHVHVNSPAPKFADSFKFFIKETSNEYYNLAMDRWYNAEDGNIWLSFPSSERNKVDEETFLILKKEHDGSTAVTENYKYKILSIVGEAPVFVKTISRFVTTLTNTSVGNVSDALFGQVVGSSISEGYPLPNLDFFMIDTATYQNAAISEAFEPKRTFVRFRTATAASNYYKILNVTTGNASSGTATKLTIEGRFGSDMDFTSTANSISTRVSGLIADFKTESVEDKPEFEGRFFAKIYKDLGVRQYITKETSEEVDNLIVSKALPVRWVKTDGVDMKNALTSDTSGINSPTHQFSSPLSFTEWGAVDVKGGASTVWHGVSNSNFDNDGELGGFGLDPDQIGSNVNSQGAEYWRDFARVYSGSASGSGDNNHFFIDEAFYRQELDTNGTGISGTKAGRGRGIRPNSNPSASLSIDQDLIDISWANIHPPGDTAAFSASEYPIAYDFIFDLYRVGTRFRFRDDPDQIVYTVESLEGHKQRIQNYRTDGVSGGQNQPENKRETWTMSVSPRFGNGSTGYHPLKPNTHFEVSSGNGLGRIAVDRFHNNVGSTAGTATGTARDGSRLQPHGNSPGHTIEILQTVTSTNSPDDSFTDNPGLWETEPKEDVGLDIYYEIGRTYPMKFDFRTNEQLIPVGSTVSLVTGTATNLTTQTVTACNDNTVTLSSVITNSSGGGDRLKFTFPKEYDTDLPGAVIMQVDSSSATAGSSNAVVTLYPDVHQTGEFILPYFNCYNFGNGNESNRIRDDFNAPTIDKGVKVSTVTTEPYTEERKSSSLIFSGIYNSRNGVNNLNQFVASDGITKDLNPKYGSIQKLHSRDGDVVTFMEDKIFKVQANKDSLFNVDGSTNLVSTNAVLGFPTPVKGEYGISKNPESFVFQGYQAYFTDKARGAVLRMSMDGLTVISNAGMKDYFSDTFKTANTNIIGTYDDKKSQYNVTLKGTSMTDTTVSWNEGTKGWVSFKSFIPESGVSFNNTYYTFFDGELYEHHNNATRNNFYGTQYNSDFTLIMNDVPGSVKNFKTLNYEGTQAKVTQFQTSTVDSAADDLDGTYNDGQYYNLNAKTGWFVENITTDMQEGLISEFKEKENKWFNYIRGAATTLDNLDTSEFSVQGLGKASAISRSDTERTVFKLTVNENND
jgi:hypothetical protein